MSFGVLIVTAWFFAVAVVLIRQYVGGAFARPEQESEDAAAPVLMVHAAAAPGEPVYALGVCYKRAKAPACARRRASAA